MSLAGALVVTALSTSVHRDLVLNPVIPEELKLELNLERVSFVSNDRLKETLARTTATSEQVSEAVRINTEARLRALKISLIFLSGLAVPGGVARRGRTGSTASQKPRPRVNARAVSLFSSPSGGSLS